MSNDDIQPLSFWEKLGAGILWVLCVIWLFTFFLGLKVITDWTLHA